MSRPSVMNSKMGNNSRGLKLLGLRVVDIISSIFPQSRDANGGNGGKLMRSEFFGFWNQVSSADCADATVFLEALLDQFRSMIEARAPVTHTISMETIVNTIAFFVLYSQFRIDNRCIKTFVKFWQEHTHDAVRDNHSINNVVRILNIRCETEFDDMLGPLIIGASTLLSHRELAQTFSKHVSYDESDLQSNEFGFVYPYLCQLTKSLGSDLQLSVLGTILNKTLTLAQQMKLNPILAETTMFALLHMAKQFLAHDAISNVSFLKRSIATIQPYYMWPQPHGTIARQLMEAFQSELLSPGWSRREALMQEAVVVDYNTEREPGYPYTKPLFYLYDSEDASALSTLNVIDPVPFMSANIVRPAPTAHDPTGGLALPPSIQALCLLHAISADVECGGAEVDVIAKLSPSQISGFFTRLQSIDTAVATSSEQSRTTRTAEIVSLRDEMLAAGASAPAKGPLLTIPQTSTSSMPFCPPIAPIEHVRVPLLLRSKINEHEKPGQTFPAAFVYDKLQDIMSGYSADVNGKNDISREIRFVIVGNDSLTQHVVAAIYLMRKLHPEFFVGLTPKFLITPCTRSHLAGYLARHDAWYNRHIYTPLRSPAFLVPWLRDDESDLRINNDGPMPIYPTAFLRDCITQYAREAVFTLDCVIYQFEGFYEPNAEGAPDEVVPFLQRAEIGIAPVVEEFRMRNRKPIGFKAEEALKDKAFTFNPLDLSMRFTRLDLSGRRQPETVDDSAAYTSILFSNIPRKNDPSFPPDPTSGCLELHALAHKADNKKNKKNVLVLDPKQHVAESTITSASQQRFRVLADGIIYGPYSTVRISAALDTDKALAKFPIQTFFPIDP